MSNTETSKQDTIQDIALKLAEEQLNQAENENQPRERVVFVLGSKGVGKSSVINAFFEREETPKPTLALEYSYGRKVGPTQKHLLHIWELGSLDNSEHLIRVPLKSHGIDQLACVIMLDLMQPQRLWTDLKMVYEELREYSDKLLLSQGKGEEHVLYEKAKQRVKKEHMDLATLDLLLFPVVIVGGKYDFFNNCEPEVKKHICICLRSMAHLMGASLLFYSNKIQKLAKTLRDTLSHLAFGSPSNPFRNHTTDYNDALSIWYGTDSWDKISSMGVQTLHSIESNFITEIPQEQTKGQEADRNSIQDPSKDPGFREGIIDEMRSQKDEELRASVKDTQMRGKFESVGN